MSLKDSVKTTTEQTEVINHKATDEQQLLEPLFLEEAVHKLHKKKYVLQRSRHKNVK